MSTNRNLINDLEIVRYATPLEKGLPLPFLENKLTVEQGTCAVMIEGGAYKEVLSAGTHFLGKYKYFRELKAVLVDIRVKTLTVSTVREFSIAHPIPVEINLDLSVEYQVVDPRRVALEITSPLTSLFDRVIQAVRGVVVNANVEEIRRQGEGIARATLAQLKAMQLPRVLGVEVLNVLTSSIKATDTGSDALANLQMGEYTKVQDWRVDNMMLQQSQITPEWLMVNRPELYAQLAAGKLEVMKELIDKGLLDPAGFLNQPAGAPTYDPLKLTNDLLGLNSGLNQQQGVGSVGTNQLPVGNTQPTIGKDIHTRIREELNYLENQPGIKVDTKAGMDARGIPDGSYDLRVSLARAGGGNIYLYFTCLPTFPQTPPVFEVEVDGELTPFESSILRSWRGQYLVEIVREVRQYFG